jgi:hypothetical protein
LGAAEAAAGRGDRAQRRRWGFEVVDVRVVPARLEGGGPGWLAYGTLAWDLPGPGGTAAGVPGVPG